MLGIPKRKELEDLAKFQNEVIDEIKNNIPEMFEQMVEQKIKDIENDKYVIKCVQNF